MSASSDIFLILCTCHRKYGLGYYNWRLMYIERIEINAIPKMVCIVHIDLRGFIDYNILRISYLIDT